MKKIEIVKEFNEKNRHRDGGKINNAIAKVLDYAEKYLNSINTMNCQENHTINKGIDELIKKYEEELSKYSKLLKEANNNDILDAIEYQAICNFYIKVIQDLKKLKGE